MRFAKQSKGKKNIAVLLVVAMLLTIMPVAAFAVDEEGWDVTIDPSATEVTTGSTVTFVATATTSSAVTVEWTGADKTEDGNPSKATRTFNEVGSYDVTATFTTEEGESRSASVTVTVIESDENPVAMIGDTEYETLDEAIEAVNGTEEIILLKDAEITVGRIEKPVYIVGNGHTVDVIGTGGGSRLYLGSELTFKNTKVDFHCATDWSLVMGQDNNASMCVLNLLDNTVCTFRTNGIYTGSRATINVENDSSLELYNTVYTSMMAVKYSYLNLKNDAKLIINHAYKGDGVPNGLNNFITTVDNSKVIITDCENQGIVGGHFELLNGSTANISNNACAINTFGGRFEDATKEFRRNAIIVNDGTTLTMNNNGDMALTLQSKADFIVKKGGTVEAKYNGDEWSEISSDHHFLDSTISIGAWYGKYFWASSNLIFEDGADVTITDNYVRGIANSGSNSYIGKGTTIMRNNAYNNMPYGGGIYNLRNLELHEDVQIYNNHAGTAGDDIYNAADWTNPGVAEGWTIGVKDAAITFNATAGEGWQLDGAPDCNDKIHAIDGWYDDSENNRWNAHKRIYHTDKLAEDAQMPIVGLKALKAAHGLEFTINKVDAAGNIITSDEATFVLTKEVDNAGKKQTVYYQETDGTINWGADQKDATKLVTNKGTVTVINLPEGDYSIVEIKAPEGYKLAEKAMPVTIDYEKSNPMVINFVNKKNTIPPDPEKPTNPDPVDPPEEEITDPDVPLVEPDDPTTEIDEPDVPLIDVPGTPVEEIDEPEVPLGDAPKTGDAAPIVGLIGLLIVAVAGLVVVRRKFN